MCGAPNASTTPVLDIISANMGIPPSEALAMMLGRGGWLAQALLPRLTAQGNRLKLIRPSE